MPHTHKHHSRRHRKSLPTQNNQPQTSVVTPQTATDRSKTATLAASSWSLTNLANTTIDVFKQSGVAVLTSLGFGATAASATCVPNPTFVPLESSICFTDINGIEYALNLNTTAVPGFTDFISQMKNHLYIDKFPQVFNCGVNWPTTLIQNWFYNQSSSTVPVAEFTYQCGWNTNITNSGTNLISEIVTRLVNDAGQTTSLNPAYLFLFGGVVVGFIVCCSGIYFCCPAFTKNQAEVDLERQPILNKSTAELAQPAAATPVTKSAADQVDRPRDGSNLYDRNNRYHFHQSTDVANRATEAAKTAAPKPEVEVNLGELGEMQNTL